MAALLGTCNIRGCVWIQAALRRHPKGDDPEGVPGGAAGNSTAPALQDGDKALFLGRAHYGCVATVIPPPVTGRGRKVTSKNLCCQMLSWMAVDVLISFANPDGRCEVAIE